VRYPLVEAGTGALFVALAARMDSLGLLSALPAYLYFGAIGIALALIDLDCRRLPTPIVLPSYPVLAVLLAASAAWQGDWWSFVRALIGAAALFAFFLAIVLIHPPGMGFGDVRLSGLIGGVLAYLSWSTMVIGAFAGFFLGALVGVVVISVGRGGRKTAIPFGPFMIAGALLAVFVGGAIAGLYRGLVS
jgi:leader peptidase (prepilin peptidase)/N-methyltransferase